MTRKRFSFKFQLDVFLMILYIFISGILLAFSSGGFVVNFREVGFSFFSGVQKSVYSIGSLFSGTLNAITELSELRVKYTKLVEQLEDYELLQRTNADIHIENNYLKELLCFSESLEVKNIPAEIIARDPNNLYSSITINRGARHGIKKNMPVVSFQGSNTALVGKIVQVGRSTSMIMPIYDYQCFVSARLQNNRYEGLVNGQGNPDMPLVMKYIKKRAREEIALGDMIVTSGENYFYPKNVSIGFVSRIRVIDYETSLEIDVEPLIDFSRLENVFVLDLSTHLEGIE